MNIRAIKESDSEQFLLLGRLLDDETQFMMLEPGERTVSIEEQTQRIRSVLSKDNQIIFVVEHDNQLIGFLGAYGGNFRRNHHCVYIVIGIRQSFTGQGIGKQLFEALEKWAIDHKLHRLELTVMSHNERAIHLYQKMGFKIEGTKQDSLWINGKYVDEYFMAKILNSALCNYRLQTRKNNAMDRPEWLKEKRRSAEARYDSRWAPIYDENWGAVIEPSHQKFLAKFLNACPAHSHILDAACGTGKYWRTILESGHTVFGTDQSQEMLNRAQEKFPGVQTEKIGMQEMRFQEIFDAAICMDAMEFVFPEDWALVLENIHRAIKPNGCFYFTVEVASESELEKVFNAAQQMGYPVVEGEWAEEEGYHYYPKPEQVREWVQQVGFKLIEESFQDSYWHFLVYKP